MTPRGYSLPVLRVGQVNSKRSTTVSLVLALGVILVLVGFALVVPRGALAGSASHRNIGMGSQRVFTTPGYKGEPSTRYRIIRVVVGLLLLVGGVVLIATSG